MTSSIGLPRTLPPKSSIAICAAVTEPWPVGVEAGPVMSGRTPILTTSSETWALAILRLDASSTAARPIVLALIFIMSSLFVGLTVEALFGARDSALLLRRERPERLRSATTYHPHTTKDGPSTCAVSASRRARHPPGTASFGRTAPP